MADRELQVINSVLESKDIQTLFANSVDDLFTAYGDVWGFIRDYYAKHRAVPGLDVVQDKFPELEEIRVSGPTAYYVDSLREEFIANRTEAILLKASQAMDSGEAPNFVLNKLQQALQKLNRFNSSSRDLNLMDFEEAERHYDEVRRKAEENGGVPGIPTGIDFIDASYTRGLSGGDFVVVLGWTGRAKSMFTTLLCCNAHDKGERPMIVSLEMPGEKVRDRVYTIKGSGLFSNSGLSLGDIAIDNFRTFKNRNETLTDFQVIENDGMAEMTPNTVQAKIDQYKPTMVVFDYAQLATDNSQSGDMTARMRNMSKEFKRMAVANDIPIILISSATPDSAASTKTPPTIEQVAWSKQLAFDADLAFSVHKNDDSNLIDIVCQKNRNGPKFAGILDWDIDNGLIEEVFE